MHHKTQFVHGAHLKLKNDSSSGSAKQCLLPTLQILNEWIVGNLLFIGGPCICHYQYIEFVFGPIMLESNMFEYNLFAENNNISSIPEYIHVMYDVIMT